MSADHARERRAVLWLIPALLAVHNAEEAWAFGRDWPRIRARVSSGLDVSLASKPAPMWAALAAVTVMSFLLIAWVVRRPDDPRRLWAALLIQAVVALNVVSHVMSAAGFNGYTPGLITAIALNLPFSVYIYVRARRERWVAPAAAWMLAPTAILVHGPLLLAALWLSGVVEGAS